METPNTDTAKAPAQEPAVVDEKRYKDVQAAYTKSQQELKEMKEQYARDRELLDQVTPYVDFDKMNGKQAPSEDDDMPVTKAELKKMRAEQEQRLASISLLQKFRLEHPDMVEYEDQVNFFMQTKTDPRRSMDSRLESATKMVKDSLERERQRGVELAAKASTAKEQKEAQSEGLESTVTAPEKAPEPEPTPEDYVAYRKTLRQKKAGQTIY